MGSIKLEGSPSGIVVSSDGALAYVANTGPDSKSISVINLNSDTVAATINLSNTSASIALTPDDSKILVSLPSADAVLAIDARNYNIIDQIGLDKPTYIMISGDGSYAYVTSGSSNWISQVSLSNFTLTNSFRAGNYPMGVVENPINGDLLVSNRIPSSYLGSILVLDSNFVAQDTIDVDGYPTVMVFSEDEALLWVTVGISGEGGSLLSIDAGDYIIKSALTGECDWPLDLAIVPGETGGELPEGSP